MDCVDRQRLNHFQRIKYYNFKKTVGRLSFFIAKNGNFNTFKNPYLRIIQRELSPDADFSIYITNDELELPKSYKIYSILPIGYGPYSSWDGSITFRSISIDKLIISGHVHGSVFQKYDIQILVNGHII